MYVLKSVEKESANIFDNIIKNSENSTESGTNEDNLIVVKKSSCKNNK